jgi:hypothetical protein
MSSMGPEVWAELKRDKNYTAIVGGFTDSADPAEQTSPGNNVPISAAELMQDRADKERLKRLVQLTKMPVWSDVVGIIKGNLDRIERSMRAPKLSRDELGDLALQKLAIQNLLDSFLEIVTAAQEPGNNF